MRNKVLTILAIMAILTVCSTSDVQAGGYFNFSIGVGNPYSGGVQFAYQQSRGGYGGYNGYGGCGQQAPYMVQPTSYMGRPAPYMARPMPASQYHMRGSYGGVNVNIRSGYGGHMRSSYGSPYGQGRRISPNDIISGRRFYR